MTLLDRLDPSDVQWLSEIGEEHDLAPGEPLIEQGQDMAAIYLVLSGLLATPGGRLPGVPFGPGEVLGEFSFLDGEPASAQVTAVEASRVLRVEHRVLSERFDGDAPFAARFFRAIGWSVTTRLKRVLKLL